jgi:anti-sigma regulatory factor (Ser/Thr protein kinase)
MSADSHSFPVNLRSAQRGYGHFSAVLSGDADDVPPVRRAVHDVAVANGFGDRSSDLALALDELLANAREHGRPPIQVETWYDGRVVLEVTDSGDGFSPRLPTDLPARADDGGRGLWIIRQIADHVAITSSDRGTTVRVEMSHEPHIGA